MELSQIRYVLAAAKHLNFTRAAAECDVSQPALTKAVKALEVELGAPLFHREGRRVLLSEFGRSVLKHLERMADEAQAAHSFARDYRLLNKAPLRLGVMSSVGHVRLARFLGAFQNEFEGVEMAVTEGSLGDLSQKLHQGELDVAILNPLDGVDEAFQRQDLYEERYVVVFPPGHRLGHLNAIRLTDLSGEPCVDRLACEMREMFAAVCKDAEVNLYARFRSEREDWIQAMVLARIGFAVMPEYSVTLPDLLQRPLVDPVLCRTISMITPRGRPHSPAMAAMVRSARSFSWPG